MRFALWLATLIFFSHSVFADTKLCDNVILKEGELKLSRNERVLVCGSNTGGEGWRDVPLPQAQYQIKILLQENGYLNPRFHREGDQLFVWSGPRAVFNKLEVYGGQGLVNAGHKRKVKGHGITPEKLDEITKWAETELRTQGFACPQVDVKAQAWDGRAVATLTPGQRQKVASIKRTGLESLDEDALLRYQAFEVGEVYDVRETQLTASRLLGGGLVQSAYFTTACRGEEVDLHLRASVGPPKLLRFGIGASTEEFPFADLSFTHARLDDRASSLTATLHGSPRLQSLTLGTELFIVPWSKQTFFGPRARVARKSEKYLEELQAKLGADLGRYWDQWNIRWRGRFGPTLNYVNTIQGKGPDDVSFLSWEGSMVAMNHEYEASQREQYSGWEASVDYRGHRKGIGSYINVDRYELDFKNLWNLGSYAPPLFVLGARVELIGVNSNEINPQLDRNLLPSEYRVFYGGDDNLRGFSRQSLNNQDLGYLTAAYAGFELRLIEELPWKLEPFLLYDIAKLGNSKLELDPAIYSSWGLGMRWASPFGTLRFSAARGEINNQDKRKQSYPEEWVVFFSFGQEF